MNLRDLLNDGKLKPHQTSSREVSDLLKLIERDLADASITSLSTDRRFAIAYNAILQLSTILLYAKGYKKLLVRRVILLLFRRLKRYLVKKYYELIDSFDACRSKRNISDYDRVGVVSEKEVVEILEESKNFKNLTIKRLKNNYPNLISEENI